MLKTRVGNEIWLVHQPDHARVAGYLAAHWGRHGTFAMPGYYAASPDPELLRQEVVHAIAEHDNGWWEWEASPSLDQDDDLPRNLPDVAKEHADAGLQRWRIGVPRLAQQHPYVSLLISHHAYWLYAFAFDDLTGLDDAFRHPIFGAFENVNQLVADRELTRKFLHDQQETQRELAIRLQAADVWSAALDEKQLKPHVRLMQLMDAMSLLICFGGQRELMINNVPRLSWDDRIQMAWQGVSQQRIVCDPYPFDIDPLPVFLPARVIPATPNAEDANSGAAPLVNLYATPIKTIRIELASRHCDAPALAQIA